jgi:hypothetical protein
MPTSAPGHAAVTDRQGRLTLTMIDDTSITTTSTASTTPLTFVSRLMSSDVQNDTKVDQVVEVGTNGIVGGVPMLGEFKGKFSRNDTSSKLLGLVTGKKFVTGTQTWNYYDLSNSKFDYVRLIADPLGNVYTASIGIDAILSGANFSSKTSGISMEEYDFMGPQLVYINGFPICKVYAVLSADATAGYVPIAGVLGAGEAPNPVLPPAAGQPPNSLYQSGRAFFLKVTRVPSTQVTIAGANVAAGTRVRYREVQPYKITAASMSTIGAQTAVSPSYIKADGTTVNYIGPELTVGATIVVDPCSANTEQCTLTAVTATTISFTTTKVHSATGVIIGTSLTSGQCIYDPIAKKLAFGDALTATDTIRLLFASYGTNSTPATIGTTSLDTTDVPGVPGRSVPISISAYQIPRASTCDIKVAIDRKQVQGLGETEIVYGTAGVPKIDYSLDVIATDTALTMALQTGSTTPGAGGDIYSADFTARYMLANPSPLLVTIKNPNNNAVILKTYQGNLPVLGSQAESGTSSAEMTMKYTGADLSGAITITAYA